MLEQHFKLKVLGNLRYFLGLKVATSAEGIHLCQHKYALQLLSDTGFTASKPTPIPMNPDILLSSDIGDLLPNPSEFRRLIGRLMYPTISRPVIAFTVNKLSQFMSKPRQLHLQAIHHLLRYIKGSPGKGLLFSAESTLSLSAYVNADWGSCTSTRKSTTGFCVYLGSAMVSSTSKKQVIVARNSTEAEYRALALVTSELLWFKQLLRTFDIHVDGVIYVTML